MRANTVNTVVSEYASMLRRSHDIIQMKRSGAPIPSLATGPKKSASNREFHNRIESIDENAAMRHVDSMTSETSAPLRC